MKNFFTLFLFSYIFFTYQLAFSKTCTNQGPILVIDAEESEFLGKEVGTQYQCGEWLNYKKIKVYNLINPKKFKIFDIDDDKYKIIFINKKNI